MRQHFRRRLGMNLFTVAGTIATIGWLVGQSQPTCFCTGMQSVHSALAADDDHPATGRAAATVCSSREQARQSLFRQRTANLVDLLRQQYCIGLELFDVVSGAFAFELFQIGDAGVKTGQLNVKLLNFRVRIPSDLLPASRQSHRRAPCCTHAFVNVICGGMEKYSRQTWTDHATFFAAGRSPGLVNMP